MASSFWITRQILLLLQGWFVRPMSSTSFAWGKNHDLSGIRIRDIGFSSRQSYQLSHGARHGTRFEIKLRNFEIWHFVTLSIKNYVLMMTQLIKRCFKSFCSGGMFWVCGPRPHSTLSIRNFMVITQRHNPGNFSDEISWDPMRFSPAFVYNLYGIKNISFRILSEFYMQMSLRSHGLRNYKRHGGNFSTKIKKNENLIKLDNILGEPRFHSILSCPRTCHCVCLGQFIFLHLLERKGHHKSVHKKSFLLNFEAW
jgi:hypothetical protein